MIGSMCCLRCHICLFVSCSIYPQIRRSSPGPASRARSGPAGWSPTRGPQRGYRWVNDLLERQETDIIRPPLRGSHYQGPPSGAFWCFTYYLTSTLACAVEWVCKPPALSNVPIPALTGISYSTRRWLSSCGWLIIFFTHQEMTGWWLCLVSLVAYTGEYKMKLQRLITRLNTTQYYRIQCVLVCAAVKRPAFSCLITSLWDFANAGWWFCGRGN